MIYWAPFLHFYQPPTQFHVILQKVCNESYRPLVKIFKEQPQAKVTINICGVLTEMLNIHGGSDIISDIREFAESGRLEFVESAKYHPILPLIPQAEIRRQIDQNRKTNSYFFKGTYKPQGFYPPEMCYSNELASIVSSLGYKWILIAGVACTDEWPLSTIYKVRSKKNEIAFFFRDDVLSNKISFHGIDSRGFISELINLSKNMKKDIYVITAMDAETFGHHIQHWEELFLSEVYRVIEGYEEEYPGIKQKADLAKEHKEILTSDIAGKIEIVTISELLDIFPVRTSRMPLPSSWSTTKEDIQKQNYYPLWNDTSNPIHKLQWEHVNICLEMVDKAMELKESYKEGQQFADISRLLMDSSIHSCQFWWANIKGKMWDINMVNKGLLLQEEVLLNAYKAIALSPCDKDIKKTSYRNLLASREISNRIRDYLFEM